MLCWALTMQQALNATRRRSYIPWRLGLLLISRQGATRQMPGAPHPQDKGGPSLHLTTGWKGARKLLEKWLVVSPLGGWGREASAPGSPGQAFHRAAQLAVSLVPLPGGGHNQERDRPGTTLHLCVLIPPAACDWPHSEPPAACAVATVASRERRLHVCTRGLWVCGHDLSLVQNRNPPKSDACFIFLWASEPQGLEGFCPSSIAWGCLQGPWVGRRVPRGPGAWSAGGGCGSFLLTPTPSQVAAGGSGSWRASVLGTTCHLETEEPTTLRKSFAQSSENRESGAGNTRRRNNQLSKAGGSQARP